ncbi:hypothetical protein IKF28_02080 [Candidatus Saccharibacteria bacterium]|nr:hypothetical protein [Candidatus Saccharibacteria bacterium]
MDDYLIDRQTLGQFVDGLIKKKALPVNSPEELNNIREEAIKSLDDRIGLAIFGSFTPEQNEEFNRMLDRDDADENDYSNFFERIGLNINQKIGETLKAFGEEFLAEGQNA